MEKECIQAKTAPAAIGPYSHAIRAGALVFCSGQLGIDPSTGDLVEGIEAQTNQALRNLVSVLEACSCTVANLVKTTIFLKDMNNFPKVNEIYAGYFDGDFPARSAIQVAALPKNALVEIEAIAYKQ
ncbi:MAG TPA: RidA family protein [Rectinema sp.]|jgi:2-iminobutanoate/2-iminopropanoate deaminase|nr:RidA family protein [Spirochaetota bacterium]OQC74841.1 MAG: Enamine/imine deaminase [Spirochaetes bacterium ADurb.Bin001]HNP93845.1 RidA family protein [Rectinema sp.]HNT60112.1 RidA family protein [Rectinema sp.]HNV36409.1 RidA family protein [Rectinema sp.]